MSCTPPIIIVKLHTKQGPTRTQTSHERRQGSKFDTIDTVEEIKKKIRTDLPCIIILWILEGALQVQQEKRAARPLATARCVALARWSTHGVCAHAVVRVRTMRRAHWRDGTHHYALSSSTLGGAFLVAATTYLRDAPLCSPGPLLLCVPWCTMECSMLCSWSTVVGCCPWPLCLGENNKS